MRTIWIAVLGIALSNSFVGSVPLQRGGDIKHFLDLTDPSILRTSPDFLEGGDVGFSGQRETILPLELQLLRLDRQEYIFGTPFHYEVAIKNIGSTPVRIPWSADRKTLESHNMAVTRATLALVLTEVNGREHLVGATILEGSDGIAGSFETLLPRESAVIRIPGVLSLPPDAASRVASDVPRSVYAVLMMDAGPSVRWQRVVSTNPLSAVLRLGGRR